MVALSKDLLGFINILYIQVWVDLKTNISNTRLGYFWWILDPLILMAIYYFIVHTVLGRGGPGYHIFVFCGIVGWQWFSRSINMGTTAFRRGKNLIKQTRTPLVMYIISPTLVNMVFALCGFAIVIVFARNIVVKAMIFLVPIVFIQCIFLISISCFLAVINVHLPDIHRVIRYVLRCFFYLSPILYSPERVLQAQRIPELAKKIYMWNPVAILLPSYRDILINGNVPDLARLSVLLAVSLALLYTGVTAVKLHRNLIPKML